MGTSNGPNASHTSNAPITDPTNVPIPNDDDIDEDDIPDLEPIDQDEEVVEQRKLATIVEVEVDSEEVHQESQLKLSESDGSCSSDFKIPAQVSAIEDPNFSKAIPVQVLLDTGSDITCISPKIIKKFKNHQISIYYLQRKFIFVQPLVIASN